ncbi:MAG TPA: hypothetical protein VN253_10075 [Kofleriaceae bacterium]|nr:hypothetical protein [Kofleriaceae bacterium]
MSESAIILVIASMLLGLHPRSRIGDGGTPEQTLAVGPPEGGCWSAC